MKRALFMISGFCWLVFAVGFFLFLLGYLGRGAGAQELPPLVNFSSGSVVLGLVHTVGLILLCAFCALVGMALVVRGVAAKSK